MKKCIVYSLRVANELIKRGYQVINVENNIQFPRYKVFFFEDTPEVRKTIEEIK